MTSETMLYVELRSVLGSKKYNVTISAMHQMLDEIKHLMLCAELLTLEINKLKVKLDGNTLV